MQCVAYNRCSVNIFQNKERKVCAHKQETSAFGFLEGKKRKMLSGSSVWRINSLQGGSRSSCEARASAQVPHTRTWKVRLNRD